MKSNLFPHFSRKISALIWPRLEKLSIWSLLLGFLAINLYAKANFAPRYWDKLIDALSQPYVSSSHLALAQALWQEGLWREANSELRLAQAYWKPQLTSTGNRVLGAASAPADLLSQWQNLAPELRRQYAYWQRVIKEKPDYVDAYLNLGALGYQLFRDEQAKLYLEKALLLDPNSQLGQSLLALVTQP